MSSDLRILLLEDNPADAELIEHELRRAGIQLSIHRVDTRNELIAALSSCRPDVILSDYSLPNLNGLAALALARNHAPSTPFIMVTGSLPAETAVECMKSGAWDYVAKGRLFRLAPAIHAALETKRLRDEKSRSDEALARSNDLYEIEEVLRKLSSAVEQSTGAIVITDTEGRIEYANRSYAVMTGYALEDIIGRNPRSDNTAGELPDLFGPAWGALRDVGEWRGERQCRRKSGELYWESASYTTIMNSEDEVTNYLITIHDCTDSKKVTEELEKACGELKATQAKVIQQEKMASIGQLAAGVAHEINNPMGFISSNLGTLGKYLNRLSEFIGCLTDAVEPAMSTGIVEKRKSLKIDYLMEDGKDLINESLEGAERVRAIVRNLKSFSRVDESQYKAADINECLESTITIAWNELKYKASLVREMGDIPMVRCYPQEINQVFMNLLVNAAQAIEKQGEIRVRTWNDAESVFASVSDTGCGIPESVRNRIFEPFFTTKEVGKGTGLGLSITYDIIKKHRGEISVESEPGMGSTFTVRLPLV